MASIAVANHLLRLLHLAEAVIGHGQEELRVDYRAANCSAERIVCVDGFCQRRLSLIPAAVAIERSSVGREVIRILRARLHSAFRQARRAGQDQRPHRAR